MAEAEQWRTLLALRPNWWAGYHARPIEQASMKERMEMCLSLSQTEVTAMQTKDADEVSQLIKISIRFETSPFRGI